MGGQASGAGSFSKTRSISGPNVEEFARRYEDEFGATRGTLLDQLMQGLSSGLPTEAVSPLVARGIDSARSSLTARLKALQEQAIAQGVRGDDPFLRSLLFNADREGSQEIAGIPSKALRQFVEMSGDISVNSIGRLLSALTQQGATRGRSFSFNQSVSAGKGS